MGLKRHLFQGTGESDSTPTNECEQFNQERQGRVAARIVSGPHSTQYNMLELRPICENCNALLPPDSDAMICSFECTFCRSCVENVLENVCPNCGGGFCARPIRPRINWKEENYLGAFPATSTIKLRPVNPMRHKLFSKSLRTIPPQQR